MQGANTLDLIIWLNAPYPVLIECNNLRAQKQALKEKSRQKATQYLLRYQQAYDHVLTQLTTYNKPDMLIFDTSQTSIEVIIDAVQAHLTDAKIIILSEQ